MYADEEEVRLVPAAVVLMLTGALAAMLAMQAAILASPLTLPVTSLSLALLAAGSALRPWRAWSLRAAAWIAPGAAVVWLATFVIADAPGDITVAAVSLAMAAASLAVRHQLLAILAGPAWLRGAEQPAAQAGGPQGPDGWIEDVAEAA